MWAMPPWISTTAPTSTPRSSLLTGPATQYYTVVFKNENGEDQSKIVASTSEPISLPDLPDQGYNHFVGWTDGTHHL